VQVLRRSVEAPVRGDGGEITQMPKFHAGNSSDYQKYERGQKHGIGQPCADRIFSCRSATYHSHQPTPTMIAVALVLAAFVLLTGWDTAGHQE
jgi:hypothetical protein